MVITVEKEENAGVHVYNKNKISVFSAISETDAALMQRLDSLATRPIPS